MKKEYKKFLLIPLLFATMLLINMGSAEAFENPSTLVWNNVSDTTYDGDLNMSINMTSIVALGIVNVSFYATGQDSVQKLIETKANSSGNQTYFSVIWDTTGYPDQIYELDAIACNLTNSIADGADITALSAVVLDNADLTMSWEHTTVGYDDTIGGYCPKDSTLYIGINGSDDEMINANPYLYFKSRGSSKVYTNRYTVTRGASSLNYTTTVNNTFSTLLNMPQDLYQVWATYQDTDETYYNTSELEIEINCEGVGPVALFLAEEEKEEVDTKKGIAIVVCFIAGLWLYSKFSGS